MSKNKTKTTPLFRELAEQWIGMVKINSKESTAVKYRNILDNHLMPEFANRPIQAITTAVIEDFTLRKLQNGRKDGRGGLSPKTVRDILGILRSILQFAENRDIFTHCNMRNVHIKLSQNNYPVISKPEQKILVAYLMRNETPRNIGVLVSLYMGLRIGELCALRWEDIHLDEKIVHIRHTMQRIQTFTESGESRTEVVITTPKSVASVRDIPIPPFLLNILKRHPHSPAAFLLTDDERCFLEPRTFQYYFQRILKLNNLPLFNYHSLRHTFATRCIEAGFDLKSLSEILGHSTVNITLNRYVHSSMEMKRLGMDKLGENILPSEAAAN